MGFFYFGMFCDLVFFNHDFFFLFGICCVLILYYSIIHFERIFRFWFCFCK